MTFFQPNYFFIIPLLLTLFSLGKRHFIEKIKFTSLSNLGILFLIQLFAVFQIIFPQILPLKHYYLIQIAFTGFLIGTLFVREFFKRFKIKEEPGERKHQRNVKQKLPVLIAVAALTLQNTSGLEQWVGFLFCLLLLASAKEVFKREGKGILLNSLIAISTVMILQTLLSLLNIGNIWPWWVSITLSWLIIIYFVEKIEDHYRSLKQNE